MTIDSRIKFEEGYVSDEYKTTTYYFTMDKSLLDELYPDKFPEAEHGEISVEFPTNQPEANVAHVEISPTKDGTDYEWNDIDLPYDDVEKLMDIARKEVK